MYLRNYLWDNLLRVVFNVAGIIAVAVFVGLIAGPTPAFLIAGGWAAVLIVNLTVGYYLFTRRVARIGKISAATEDKFLLSEIVPEPLRAEDRLYYELMIMQGRAAIARVMDADRRVAEYYDYIQEWVHEVKIPITAISLICAHNDSEDYAEIARQTNKINDFTEQVLYEAKSNNTEKDLLIKETPLARVVNEYIKENKRYFIDAGVKIVTDLRGVVYTDEKWLTFILKQIMQNSVQYSKDENPTIEITAAELPGDKIALCVRDNGIGITKSDLPRVFDKGFTGSNGRRNKKSTGLGLYLCKKLCAALDVELSAASVPGEYTALTLIFNAPPGKSNETVRKN